jgi:hydroxyacylglutathione hydrolase
MALQYDTIVCGPFQENCYLVFDDTTHQGIFVDPGAEPERLIRIAASKGVEIIGIYNTHGHIDHVGAVSVIKEKLGVPFAIHPDEQMVLESVPAQARLFGVSSIVVPTIDHLLSDGDRFNVGALEAKVIHTPGHSPGGVCFVFEDAVFVGDTLFAGSIGRSDLIGGSLSALLTAIKSRLLTLEDDVVVLPGHGPATTIGEERTHNPFLTGRF